MRDRNYLLLKEVLRLAAGLVGCIPLYFMLSDKTLGLLVAVPIITGVVVWSVRSMVLNHKNNELDVMYRGFNFKDQLMLFALIVTIAYATSRNNAGPQFYILYPVAFFLLIIADGLKLIIFDFEKKQVTGLFKNRKQSADQMSVDHIPDESSYKIRVTDKSGFFVLDSKDFATANWDRLVKNLDRFGGL
ncbi:MAG: hypothetical protein QM762_04490 [Chryseolinea sp.]